jgi:hypothetical protein
MDMLNHFSQLSSNEASFASLTLLKKHISQHPKNLGAVFACFLLIVSVEHIKDK